MVLLHTPEKKNGFTAPAFTLKGTDGRDYSFEDCAGAHGTVVMFICNHCPYVLAIAGRLADTCRRLQDQGIGCVAIMSNDTQAYPQDSFDNMVLFAAQYGFSFPYLIDETQEIARAYDAVCTPDFFGFDRNATLQYRGRLDSATNQPATHDTVPELYNAMMNVKETGHVSQAQKPSMGCSIKWKNI